jgi:2'-5' RNA ligase
MTYIRKLIKYAINILSREEKYLDGTHVCVVAPVASNIASQYPKDIDDAHITILYIGDLPKKYIGSFLDAVMESAIINSSTHLTLDDKVTYFEPSESSDGKRVVKLDVFGSCLEEIHTTLKNLLTEKNIPFSHSFPDYHPHTTLAYLEPTGDFKGDIPSGSWGIDSIEIWGFDEKISIPIVSNQMITSIISKSYRGMS